jgi:hypothetical protein
VKSPRYLLSALGQGDVKCIQALQFAVQDITNQARSCLKEARELREKILQLGDNVGNHTVAVLLPAVTSETFLSRLESHQYDLTNRQLRNVSMIEHTKCSLSLLQASFQKRY